MSVNISGVLSSDTPNEGRIKLNANDEAMEALYSFHLTDPAAHIASSGDGEVANTEGAQTFRNKTIASANNTLNILTQHISDPFISLKSLEYDDNTSNNPGTSDTTQDFGYDQNESGGVDVISISGQNGLEVRKINQGNIHHGLVIRHPHHVALNHNAGQTLSVNSATVEANEVFKVTGKSTFTDQVTVGGDLLPSADGSKDLGSAGAS
jgi:hypothetical protein